MPPANIPMAGKHAVSLRIMQMMVRCCAPSAFRMPISFVRRLIPSDNYSEERDRRWQQRNNSKRQLIIAPANDLATS